MLLVSVNCFLWHWRVDYALEENILTEQMWIFATYFILRGRDTHWFSTSFENYVMLFIEASLLAFLAGWLIFMDSDLQIQILKKWIVA